MRPQLTPTEVHVFYLELDAPHGDSLDEGERQRAARFVFERDQRRFRAAHAQVREILGLILQADAASLRFEVAEKGKPSLAGLQFNLSHSGERALLAVHAHLAVGVDIEEERPNVEFRAIAERMFSPVEVAALLAEPDLRAGFYRVWTSKEAFIKLLGEGLAFPLRDFDVSLLPEGGLDGCRRHDPARFWLRSLPCEPGFAAALAVEGPPQRVWRWRYRSGTLVPADERPPQ